MLRQTLAASTASLTIMVAAQWTSYIAPIIVKINNNETGFSVTEEHKSWIVSIMDMGNVLSPIPAGFFMDRYGRKDSLILCAIINLVASLIVILATSGQFLFYARLLAGIGKGISFTVSPIYVAEIASKERRGALSTTFYTFFCIGSMVTFCVTPYMSFKALNWLTIVLPFIVLLMFIWIPESAYFYVMKYKDDKAKKSMMWFQNIRDIDKTKELEAEISEMKLTITNNIQTKGGFTKLFTIPSHRRAFTILIVTFSAQRLTGISYFLSYGTVDLPDSGTVFGPYECFAVFSIISTFSTFIAGYFVDNFGRQKILLISSITSGFVLLISGLYYVICGEDNYLKTKYFYVVYIAVLIFSCTHTIGLGCIPAILQGELFPANMKRYASASIIIISSLVSFTINKIYLYVENMFGIAGMHFIGVISCVISTVYFYFFLFETKQKSFHEIQKILNKENKSSNEN